MRPVAAFACVLTLVVCVTPAKATLRHDRVVGHGLVKFNGAGPEKWAFRYRREHRRLLAERARSRRVSSVRSGGSLYAIRLAAAVFGVPEGQMVSVARCETGNSFSATSYNSSSGASGLFQFLPSTWANQGLPAFSVFDPVANALGAARIVAREGWGQWSCKP